MKRSVLPRLEGRGKFCGQFFRLEMLQNGAFLIHGTFTESQPTYLHRNSLFRKQKSPTSEETEILKAAAKKRRTELTLSKVDLKEWQSVDLKRHQLKLRDFHYTEARATFATRQQATFLDLFNHFLTAKMLKQIWNSAPLRRGHTPPAARSTPYVVVNCPPDGSTCTSRFTLG